VQKKTRKLGALLYQIQRCHAFDLAFEVFSRNPQQLAQYVSGIVEGQRLVEVAGKEKTLYEWARHMQCQIQNAVKG
jgi:hypothetical protein